MEVLKNTRNNLFLMTFVYKSALFSMLLAFATYNSVNAQFAGGSGTSGDPYQVATATQLDSVRNHLSSFFELTANIDLDISPYNTGSGWEPIGSFSNPFSGSFDGNNFTISALYINRPSESSVGLFARLDAGSIKNASLIINKIQANRFAGGWAGWAEGAELNFLEVSGDSLIAVNGYTGGLVGLAEKNTSISYSSASVIIFNKGTSVSYLGGLSGYLRDSQASNSFSSSTVIATGGTGIGGFVGFVISGSTITNSYATGSVTGSRRVGGLVGMFSDSGFITITNSYATGSVSGNQNTDGFIGVVSSVTLTASNNYWDTESSGLTSGNGATGKTTAEMQRQSTFSGWDFATTWAIDEGSGYPFLQDDGTNSLIITGNEGWRMLASPITSGSFATLLDTLWTQGFTGADVPNGTPNVYQWDEPTQSFVAITDASTTLNNGEGFIVYIHSDHDNDGTDDGFPKTLVNSGSQFLGSISPTLSYTDTDSIEADGWNLMGNPYGSTIHWDSETGWSRGSLDATFYVWSDAAGDYLSWSSLGTGTLDDGLIAPWQGFWVKANGDSPAITFTDSVRHTGGTHLKRKAAPQIKLMLLGNNGPSNSVVVFSELAELGKDDYDAYKLTSLNGDYLSLGTQIDTVGNMDIQALPLEFESIEMDVMIEGSDLSGEFNLDWELISLPEEWTLELLDRETQTTYSLKELDQHTFTLQSDTGAKIVSQISQAVQTQHAAHPQDQASSRGELASPQPLTPPRGILRTPKLAKASANDSTRFALIVTQGNSVNAEPISDVPTKVELLQNYPNPFNPSTTINFGVPKQADVRLEVFDLLGRKVADLLNEPKKAGRHTVNFDASRLASGLYLYRLQVGSSVLIKKMTLIK